MQSASTVQTIAPQTTKDHFQPTGQCSGDLQLPKRHDTGRAQHQAACRVALMQCVGTARRPIEMTLLSLAAQ